MNNQPFHWTLGNDYDLPTQPQAFIEDLVYGDLKERAQKGKVKYGRYLHESTDDMLQHAYEEALDLASYLKKEILNRK